MNWNLALLIASILMVLLLIGVSFVEPWTAAETIAEDLAPRIGVDEDIVRSNLQDILEASTSRRIIIYCTPWAIMSLFFAVRLVKTARKPSSCSSQRT